MSKSEDLDAISFDAGDVARMTGLDVKTVANWTDRGLADPYQGPAEWRRGRGYARRYSLRDTVRFALMHDLSDRYQIPLPLGRRICGAIFSEAFSQAAPGYLIVQGATANDVGTTWCKDEVALAKTLATYPMKSALVVNAKATLFEVMCAAEKARAARRENESE